MLSSKVLTNMSDYKHKEKSILTEFRKKYCFVFKLNTSKFILNIYIYSSPALIRPPLL